MKKKDTQRMPKAASSQTEVGNIVIVVISVVAILMVTWFLANKVIDMTGRGVAESSSQEVASSESSAEASSSVAEASSEAEASMSEGQVPKPQTEGPADYYEPSTWIGKTFRAKDEVNVRAAMGTSADIVGGLSSGDTITVLKADYDGEVVWVYAKITNAANPITGWIYGFALDNVPVAE